jgi:hypothetical protein
MLSLNGPPGPWLRRGYTNSLGNPDRSIRSSTGEPGLSLLAQDQCPYRSCRWHFLGSQSGPSRSCNSTPQRLTPGLLPALFFVPRTAPFQRQKSPSPAAFAGGGVVVLEPIWDDRRGPKTHSRRTGRKLGQVRCTRQGLVRVPLSNTKYGGERGITGVSAAPVMDASISESSEIRQGKKCCRAVEPSLLLPVHRPSIYSRPGPRLGLHFEDSRKATETCRRDAGGTGGRGRGEGAGVAADSLSLILSGPTGARGSRRAKTRSHEGLRSYAALQDLMLSYRPDPEERPFGRVSKDESPRTFPDLAGPDHPSSA